MKNKPCECGRRVFCMKCRRTHLCLRWCKKFNESLNCEKFRPQKVLEQ